MFRILGIIAGALSLVILMRKDFDFKFGPFLLSVLEYYERQADEFLGFLEPFIQNRLGNLSAIFGYNFALFPHWKHAFVLMWLYFGAGARTAWNLGNRWSGVFVLVWGSCIALLAGALSGTVVFNSNSRSNFFMAFWPILGVVVFNLGLAFWASTYLRRDNVSWFSHFRRYVLWVFIWVTCPGALALAIAFQADKLPFLRGITNPSYALLGTFIVYLALRNLYDGAHAQHGRGDKWWQKILYDGDTMIALDMFSVMGIATLVALLGMPHDP